MRYFLKITVMALAVLGWLNVESPARAFASPFLKVTSPDHGQTYAYGSELRRVWTAQGSDRHLALMLTYTNDPFVDNVTPRRYDYFTFNFPTIQLGKDGRTFYYRAPHGHLLPVAAKKPVFLGTEIKLLPTSQLLIEKPHGYLTVSLVVQETKARLPDEFYSA